MKKIVSISVVMLLTLCATQVEAHNLRVAVAANFSAMLALIAQQFEKTFHQHVVNITGSTGKLYAQIKHGAPFDIFMAADVARPLRLEQEHLIVDNSRYTYAIGQLALWVPKSVKDIDVSGDSVRQIHDVLFSGRFKKLAIANPKTAPYGQAAIDVMQYLHVYKQCSPKLVYGENIAQAYQFVASGNAELGFVALSYVKTKTNDYWLPPTESYGKLEQQLVILRASKNQALAKRFIEFLQRADIKAMIKAQGYQTP